MDKLHGKKLRLEEGTKEEIQFDLLRTSLTMSNWKTPGHDGINISRNSLQFMT